MSKSVTRPAPGRLFRVRTGCGPGVRNSVHALAAEKTRETAGGREESGLLTSGAGGLRPRAREFCLRGRQDPEKGHMVDDEALRGAFIHSTDHSKSRYRVGKPYTRPRAFAP